MRAMVRSPSVRTSKSSRGTPSSRMDLSSWAVICRTCAGWDGTVMFGTADILPPPAGDSRHCHLVRPDAKGLQGVRSKGGADGHVGGIAAPGNQHASRALALRPA